MSSKKVEPASLPVPGTTLRYHLKPRPIEADLKEQRKDRRSQARSRRGFRVGGSGGTPRERTQREACSDPKVQPRSEPVAGWITRAEARSVLGIDDAELAGMLTRFRLRPNLVEVYSKAEILALREIVAKLR